MEPGGERPDESDGADAENPESWYFDLPSGAWERQEAKNRELRQRVLSNLDDAPAKIDPFARKREPEPKRGGLFGMGRKKDEPDAGRETAGGTFRLQRGGAGFGDLSGALARDELAAEDWSTEPELPIPLRPHTTHEPMPPALARGYDPEPEPDRAASRWDDAFGGEGDEGGGLSAMEAWAKHSTEKPEPRTPFALRPVLPQPEHEAAIEDEPAVDAGEAVEEAHAEAAPPPVLGFVRRTQEEHDEADEAPKGDRWNELFDNGEEVASGGLNAMAEWARRKDGEPRVIPEEFLKPFDWEVEEQGGAEGDSPTATVAAPEWEANVTSDAVADTEWAVPASLETGAPEGHLAEPWLPIERESAEESANAGRAEPVAEWSPDEDAEDVSPWEPAAELPEETAPWGGNDAFAWEEEDAPENTQPSGRVAGGDEIDLFDDPLIARALGNQPATVEPQKEKARGLARFFGRKKRAPEPVVPDPAPSIAESDWLPVSEDTAVESPVADDFRTVAPGFAGDDEPEFVPPPVEAVAFEDGDTDLSEQRAGDIFGFSGEHDGRASGWGWERPEHVTPVEAQPRDAAAEFGEALAALQNAGEADDWDDPAPKDSFTALVDDIDGQPKEAATPLWTWQEEPGGAEIEAEAPVVALGEAEAGAVATEFEEALAALQNAGEADDWDDPAPKDSFMALPDDTDGEPEEPAAPLWAWQQEPGGGEIDAEAPVVVSGEAVATEFEEALAALHNGDDIDDWDGPTPAESFTALPDETAGDPEVPATPLWAWQQEADSAEIEAKAPVGALREAEADAAPGETSLTSLWSSQPSISDDGAMDSVGDEDETPGEADAAPRTGSWEPSEQIVAADTAVTGVGRPEFAWDAEPDEADGESVDDELSFAWTDPEPGPVSTVAVTDTPTDDNTWNPEPFEPFEVVEETPFAPFVAEAANDEPEAPAWEPAASFETGSPPPGSSAWSPASTAAGTEEPEGDPAVGWWEPDAEREASDAPFASALISDADTVSDAWASSATDIEERDSGDADPAPWEADATFEAPSVARPGVLGAPDDRSDAADDDPWAAFMSHRDEVAPAAAGARPAEANPDRWADVLDATDTPAEAFAEASEDDDWVEPEAEAPTEEPAEADDPWAAIAAASGYASVSPSGAAVYHDSAPESDIVASLDSQMADAESSDDAWAEFGAARRAPLADATPTPMYDEGDVVLRAFEQHAASADPETDEGWQEPEEKDEPGAFAALLGDDAEELVSEVDPMVETRAFQRLQGWAPQRPARTPVDLVDAPWEAHDEDGEAFHDPTAPLPWRGHSDDMAPPPPWVDPEQGDGAGAAASVGHSKAKTLVRELIETGLLAVLVFLAVRASFQNFKVDGQSMNPTLADGQFLIVNKLVYSEVNVQKLSNFLPFLDPGNEPQRNVFHGPERGDIVVLVDPHKTDTDLIKRVIGLPGETVEIADGHVYINDHLLEEPYIKTPWHGNTAAVTLPADMYFVMGDNRDNSLDSRSSQVGFIPKDLIIGKAMLSYWPTSRFGLAPNEAGNISQKDGPPRLTAQRLDGTDP